jgi:hypothetical protein
MKKFLIVFVFIISIIVAFSLFAYSGWFKRTPALNKTSAESHFSLEESRMEILRTKAASAKQYAKRNNYNEQICFMVDMSVNSNQNRFFVFDLKKDTINNSGLVTHGRCNEYWLEGRKYGNKVGCGCSSLGKYKIGKSYYGKFGLAYKLHGLDTSNSNAFARYVVLHSHSCVPETEVKDEICQSDGCPTVAPGFLLYLKKLINASDKPILLWVYE